MKYVGVAFSDHQAYIVKIKIPGISSKITSPKSRPQFKAKPEVVKDPIFYKRLQLIFPQWLEVRQAGLELLPWWEIIVKPGIKSLLIERGKELNRDKTGQLNLLLLRQAYLVAKLQAGNTGRLAELKQVQTEIQAWHERE